VREIYLSEINSIAQIHINSMIKDARATNDLDAARDPGRRG